MGMGYYEDDYALDPEEEELRRQNAITELAKTQFVENDMYREDPVELPPVPESLVARAASERSAPAPAPIEAPPSLEEEMGALPALPDPQAEGTPDLQAFAPGDELREKTKRLVGEYGAEEPPANSIAALAAAAKPPEAPKPSAAPAAAAPPPPAQQDPFDALMRRGEEERRKQLEAYDKEGAPGVNGWALLADVAFNKGRSIPGILQQVDNDKRAYREGRQKLITGGGSHNDPVSQMLAMKRIEVAQGREGRLATTATNKAANDALKAEAGRGSRSAMLELMKLNGADEQKIAAAAGLDDKGWAMQMPSFRRDYNLSDPMVAKAATAEGEKARERKEGEAQGTANALPTVVNNTRQIEGARQEAIAANLPNRAETPDQAKDNARQDRAAELAEENARFGREERADVRRGKWLDDFGKRTDKVTSVAQPLGRLLTRLEKAGQGGKLHGLGAENLPAGDLLPDGVTPDAYYSFNAEWEDDPVKKAELQEAIDNRKDFKFLADYVLRSETGAAANISEVERNAFKVAESPRSTTADIRSALGILREFVRGKLQLAGHSNPELAYETLQAGNYMPELYGFGQNRTPNGPSLNSAPAAQPSAPVPGAAPANPQPAAPGEFAVPGDLGTTEGKLPKQPITDDQGRTQHRVKTPSGATTVRFLHPHELEVLKRTKGFQVE